MGIGQLGRAPRAKAASFVLVFTPRCKVGSALSGVLKSRSIVRVVRPGFSRVV